MYPVLFLIEVQYSSGDLKQWCAYKINRWNISTILVIYFLNIDLKIFGLGDYVRKLQKTSRKLQWGASIWYLCSCLVSARVLLQIHSIWHRFLALYSQNYNGKTCVMGKYFIHPTRGSRLVRICL